MTVSISRGGGVGSGGGTLRRRGMNVDPGTNATDPYFNSVWSERADYDTGRRGRGGRRRPGPRVDVLAAAALRPGAAGLLRLRGLHGDARQHGAGHRRHDHQQDQVWGQRYLLGAGVRVGLARGGAGAERLLLRLRGDDAARRVAGGPLRRQVGVRRGHAGHQPLHAADAAAGAARPRRGAGAARARRRLRGGDVAQHAPAVGALGAAGGACAPRQLRADGAVAGPRGGDGGVRRAGGRRGLAGHLLRHRRGRRAVVRRVDADRQRLPRRGPAHHPAGEEVHPGRARIRQTSGGGCAAAVGEHPALAARVGGGGGALLRGLGLHHLPHAAAHLHDRRAELQAGQVRAAVVAAVRGHDRVAAQRERALRLARGAQVPHHHAGAQDVQLRGVPGPDGVPVPDDGGGVAVRSGGVHDHRAGHRRLRLLRLQCEPAGPGAAARQRHHGPLVHRVHPLRDDQPAAHRLHRHRQVAGAVEQGVLRGQRRLPVRRRLLLPVRVWGTAELGEGRLGSGSGGGGGERRGVGAAQGVDALAKSGGGGSGGGNGAEAQAKGGRKQKRRWKWRRKRKRRRRRWSRRHRCSKAASAQLVLSERPACFWWGTSTKVFSSKLSMLLADKRSLS